MVNGEQGLRVIWIFLVLPWHIFAQKVKGLISPMSRDVLIDYHLKERQQDVLQVLGCVYSKTHFEFIFGMFE